MKTQWATRFATTDSFRVLYCTPIYDWNTDGHVGTNYNEVAAFTLMGDAVTYLQARWDEQMSVPEDEIDYEVGFILVHPSGNEFPSHEWDSVHSHYTGPVDYNDPWSF